MAEEHARWKQYEYASNSNLVLTAENRGRREHEPSGEAESLATKKLFRMGDKVAPCPCCIPVPPLHLGTVAPLGSPSDATHMGEKDRVI